MHVVSYPHSEINGTTASISEGLPESKTEKDFWQQRCRDDQAFLKNSSGETAKQNYGDSDLLRVLDNHRTAEEQFQVA